MTALPWIAAGDQVRLSIRVTPKGGRDAIGGLSADAAGQIYLAVRVAAAPADGAANTAVKRLVAKALQLRGCDVALVAGETSRYKQLRLSGPPDAIIGRLEALTREQT